MQIRQAIIGNTQGIHCRPSAAIVRAFEGYSGMIRISSLNGACDVSSVMKLLALELRKCDKVKVEVMGENEEAVAGRLVELLQTHFDFPPL